MKKRIGVVFLTAALCLGMTVAVYTLGQKEPVHAQEETTIDFSKFNISGGFGSGSTGDITEAVKVSDSGSALTISKPSATRVNFVATSKENFDFSKSFSFKGTANFSTAPDGMAIAFQPDGDYGYVAGANQYGSSLGIYGIESNTNPVKNALVTEIDSYLYAIDGTDSQDVVKNAGQPHVALTAVGSNGKEKSDDTYPVQAVGVSGTSAEFTVSWEITGYDESTDAYTGTYAVTYGTTEMKYENFNPKSLFGTDQVYMTVAGSVNYQSGYPDTDWGISVTDFSYEEAPLPTLDVEETSDQTTDYAEADKTYTYTITVTNQGTMPAKGIFIRRYMPEYTNFYSVEEGDFSGSYGCVDGKEHASWYVPALKPGKSVTLTYQAIVNKCKPDNLTIGHEVLYQIMGRGSKPYMNTATDPSETATND